jgi:hypothetical protein
MQRATASKDGGRTGQSNNLRIADHPDRSRLPVVVGDGRGQLKNQPNPEAKLLK